MAETPENEVPKPPPDPKGLQKQGRACGAIRGRRSTSETNRTYSLSWSKHVVSLMRSPSLMLRWKGSR